MDLDSLMGDDHHDAHLETITYLETKRHGLAFALSYLHRQPVSAPMEELRRQQQMFQNGTGGHCNCSSGPPVSLGNSGIGSAVQKSQSTLAGQALELAGQSSGNRLGEDTNAAVLEILEHMEWTVLLALSQIECGGYLEALANVKASVVALRWLLSEGLGSSLLLHARNILCDLLVLQVRNVPCYYQENEPVPHTSHPSHTVPKAFPRTSQDQSMSHTVPEPAPYQAGNAQSMGSFPCMLPCMLPMVYQFEGRNDAAAADHSYVITM